MAVILTNTQLGAQAAQLSNTPAAPAQQPERKSEAKPLPKPPSIGGDTERAIEFCARHVTSERSFVVFSNGTCVIVDEPTSQPVIDAIHILSDCAKPDARFITREIENSHYLVTYRLAVFHCLFSEEISSHRKEIETSFLRFLTPTERSSMKANFDPPFLPGM